ncbi:lanthionine synthetase C family protein [Streptomyces sp. NPDC050439]|uniref:lanthionine synthetase C family protein n=1 Tax=unclassified Streptomyces TaxID=2593676 RepID=UPI00343C3989
MNHDDLSAGFAGSALYEMVMARDNGNWATAHDAARTLNAHPITAHPATASLYRGAPAVAYVLHIAGHRAYARALAELDAEVIAIVAYRLTAAERRMDRKQPPLMREYDLISGLTGLGAYLLHRGRAHALERVLGYLVRLLTQTLTVDGYQVPGWWAAAGQRDQPESGAMARGHVNFGIAHGVSGPLALLALAHRAGCTVDGQHQAMAEVIEHLTTWAHPLKTRGNGWPEHLSLEAYEGGPVPGAAPGRPSWCYGTPGIGRALQLAALALHDEAARRLAEDTVLQAITDPRQLAHLTDTSLCHGWAGLLLTAHWIACDASTPAIRSGLPVLQSHLSARLEQHEIPENAGLLTGPAGVLLALHTLNPSRPVQPGWETCLLLN